MLFEFEKTVAPERYVPADWRAVVILLANPMPIVEPSTEDDRLDPIDILIEPELPFKEITLGSADCAYVVI